MRKCQHNTDALAPASCVQPVDEKCVWDFFGVKACEDRQEHRAPSMQGCNTDTNTSMHTPGTRCSWECGTYEGIPPCLGARLSRRLPGETDFYQIDSRDLFTSAAADARLAQVFALLQKPNEKSHQLVPPSLRHLSDLLTPCDATPQSRAGSNQVWRRYGHTCRKLKLSASSSMCSRAPAQPRYGHACRKVLRKTF
jgi:hypothetical protein